MTHSILHINDYQLRLFQDDVPVISTPAIAHIKEQDVFFGELAKQFSRVFPREINDQFFWKMDTSPLPQTNGTYKHHADLVYGQLNALYEQSEKHPHWALLAPSHYSNEQHALLLGVCKALPIQPVGLIDTATAIAATLPSGKWKIIELTLNFCLITDVTVTDSSVEKQITMTLPLGYNQLMTQCSNIVAKTFVEQTRFDPLYNAESEQRLYQLLDQWLTNDSDAITFEHNGSQLEARLPKESLRSSLKDFWQPLQNATANQSVALLDYHRTFPGLIPALQPCLTEASFIDDNAIFDHCIKHWDSFYSPSDAQALITRFNK